METYIAYFDEAGDDGITTASSSHFVLTSLYMPASSWQSNYNTIKSLRSELKKHWLSYISGNAHKEFFNRQESISQLRLGS